MARRNERKVSKKIKAETRKRKAVLDDGAMMPTPEMLARVEFEFGPVRTEMNVQIGAAYRRRPLYLTMAKKADRFTFEELAAMRLYRSVFDRCERSPVTSCLGADLMGGGRGIGPTSFIHASPAVVEAKRKLAMLERDLGPTLSTMRDVVLHDVPFTTIAMERYGCRTRSWIIVEEPVIRDGKPAVVDGQPVTRTVHREDVVPRSGRDRARIAGEFNEGLKLLVAAVDRMTGADAHEVWVHAREDGTAIIHRASLAPNGTFRLWGRPGEVETVLNRVLAKNDDRLTFPSPQVARDALLDADDGMLNRLEADELAA